MAINLGSKLRIFQRERILLVLPAALIVAGLLVLPMIGIAGQSFREAVAGRVGVVDGAAWTLENYAALLHPAYLSYFATTLLLSGIATVAGLLVAYPIALGIARLPKGSRRKIAIGFFICMLFVSVMVRVYALALTFGPAGFLRSAFIAVGIAPNSAIVSQIAVVAGLLHYAIPISVLTLIGTIQNINPRLHEAAMALGANSITAHLSVTLPLSRPGIVSSFLIAITFCISSFVIPLVLGRGKVLFVSNLIYSRFSEMADYSSGGAIAIVLVVVTFAFLFLGGKLSGSRRDAV